MLRNYLRIALRNFSKNRVFSFINVFGLTLGIACSLAIFMIVRHEWSYDTFHPQYQRIYRVVCDFRYPEGMEYQSGVPRPLPEAFRHDFPQSQVTTIFGSPNSQISLPETQNTRRFREETGIFYAEPAFFDIFSFKWLSGNPAEVLSRPGTIALTRETAEKYFGSWQNAIGKTLLKDNNDLLTVQGILENPPTNTDFPLKGVVSFATMLGNIRGKGWGGVSSQYQCYVKFPDDGMAAQVSRQLPGFRAKYDNNKIDNFSLQPLTDIHFNTLYGNFSKRTINKETLWALGLIGIFLLVLGCINFINLSTAQAINRSREVGIRKVLGSSRRQLIGQLMGETALVVAAASCLAIGLVTLLSPMEASILNWSVPLQPLQSSAALGMLLLIAITVTLISGLYPALLISGSRPIAALKNRLSSGHPGGSFSLRRALVVAQFAIAQVLIVGVLVAISQMNFFRNAPMGFDKAALVTISLPRDSVSKTKWEAFRQEALTMSGIEKISFSYTPPAGKSNSFASFRFNQDSKDENFEANYKPADANYFSTYGLTFIAGRAYQPSDTCREFVVNETFLHKEGIRNPQDALGKYIYIDDTKAPIVGVVRDFHEHSLKDPIDPAILTTNKASYAMAGIKLTGTAIPATLRHLGRLFGNYFPDYIFEHQFLDETIARYYNQEEKLSGIFKVFAAIALIISCLGLYGLILFATTQRIREVGIRKVLGASVTSISLLFVREFCLLIGIAFVIATPIAWYAMHGWLQNFTYRISISAWMFAATGLTALLIGLLTIGYRTIRTALTSPVKTLRSE